MIVLAKNFGQLGNRLLLSAHLLAAAREYGVSFRNPSFVEYAQYFPSISNDLWCRFPAQDTPTDAASDDLPAWQRKALYQAVRLSTSVLSFLGMTQFPCRVIRVRGEQICDLQDESFALAAKGPRPILASGWKFRSNTLLEKHADAIRAHFRIQPKHRQNVDTLIGEMRSAADTVVGIHIRHGDYATWEGGKYFYSIDQYRDVMQQVADRLGNQQVTFLVCGNGNLSLDQFRGLNVRFGTGHLIEDMYALAETDLLIGPPSTFTQWASFYGQVPLQVLVTADQEIELDRVAWYPQQAA